MLPPRQFVFVILSLPASVQLQFSKLHLPVSGALGSVCGIGDLWGGGKQGDDRFTSKSKWTAPGFPAAWALRCLSLVTGLHLKTREELSVKLEKHHLGKDSGSCQSAGELCTISLLPTFPSSLNWPVEET